ncbi:MAG: phosphatase PAP2 family protein [Fimbriimonadales bacterium]
MEWLWNLDQQVQHTINVDWHSDSADPFFKIVTWIGLDQVVVPLVLLLILVRSTRRCGWQCLLAYALSGVGSMIVKRFSSRFRPGYPADGTFVAPDEQIYLNSFPSGHAAIAFAVAFTLLWTWPSARRPIVGWSALILATLVGISRIYRGVHWPTDVLASIALAYLVALAGHVIMNCGREAESRRPSEEPA